MKIDPEKEDHLFALLDQAAYTGDYTESFRYMQREKIDPVKGITSYVEQGLEVATTAIESNPDEPDHIPLLDAEKEGGLLRLRRIETVADDMMKKDLVTDEELQQLREEIQDLQQTYDYLVNS